MTKEEREKSERIIIASWIFDMTPQERAERIAQLRELVKRNQHHPDVRWLLDELAAADAREVKIRELHRPYAIYDECGHDHTLDDPQQPNVVNVNDIGLTCAKMYDICRHCCCEDIYQAERCLEHNHGSGKPICETRAILDGDSSDG